MEKKIRFVITALIFCLTAGISNIKISAEATGGLIIHNSYTDFSNGQHMATTINANTGYIELPNSSDGFPNEGMYISPELATEPFKYMVLSWNTDTPKNTAVTIEAQARVNGAWSAWLLIGTWSTTDTRTSAMDKSQSEDGIAKADTDTLVIKGQNGETADAFRYRLTLSSKDRLATPSVRLIAAAYRGDVLPAANSGTLDFTGVLDVRPVAQMTRDPQFNRVICSAVSSSMVLGYKGVDILPEMAAVGVLDTYYDGYGNWPFNAAFIGSYGFESYIKYCDSFDDIKNELMAGNPVICSVRYKRDASVEGNLPIVSNAPMDRTFGHLLVVVGYERIDGIGYVVVNDPAADNDGEVRRYYEEGQFMEAWAPAGRVAYITRGGVSASASAPRIEEASLTPTGRTREDDGKFLYEYALIGSETGPVSAARAIVPQNSDFEAGVSIVVWDDMAGAVHSYVTPGEEPNLWLDQSQIGKTVYVFLNTGNYYRVSAK